MLDLRYAIRSLSRARGFTVAVVLTLGLGIGANTAIFSVVRGVLLKPLPHRDGDRLMYLRQSVQGPRRREHRLLGSRDRRLPELPPRPWAASPSTRPMHLHDGRGRRGGPDRRRSGHRQLLLGDGALAGARARLRRGRRRPRRGAGDDADLRVLAEAVRRGPAIVGKSLRVGGKAVPVVGVLQAAPAFPQPHRRADEHGEQRAPHLRDDGDRPHPPDDRDDRPAGPRRHRGPGPGRSARTSRRKVHADYPEAYDAASGYQVTLDAVSGSARPEGPAHPLAPDGRGGVRPGHRLRQRRQPHPDARRAAGARAGGARRAGCRHRSGCAGCCWPRTWCWRCWAAALGLLIAFGGVGMLIAFAERYSPRAGEIRVDGVGAGLHPAARGLVVAVLLSYAPELARESGPRRHACRGAGSGPPAARGASGCSRRLVVAQIAVSVVLLTGAGLLTRTMQRLSRGGYRPDRRTS